MPPEEIHVWLIRLPEGGDYPGELERDLSPEELARARRFIFDRHRARFIAAHAALRAILARYTGRDGAAIGILTAEHGKPYLEEHPEIRFNLSHSGTWALVAVARDREVGVDIERIQTERLTDTIARRFFAPAEVRELYEMPDDRRLRAFFDCWARKEAYIKARGEGLGIALDSFEVGLAAEAELRKAEDRERWSMAALLAPDGYAAALAAEGAGWRVVQLVWAQVNQSGY